jgi:protein gp37
MADATGIEWCDSTINLWIGCTRISAGCDFCYAATLAKRFGVVWDAPPKRTGPASWDKIAAYQRGADRFIEKHGRPRKVFVNSMSDFFDNQAEREWRDDACLEMERADKVMFLLVTKRPQNIAKMVPAHWLKPGGWPPNVWLGVTAEDQEQYNLRVAWLLSIPGVDVAFISMEPMLEEIEPGRSISFSKSERAAFVERYTKKIVDWDHVGQIKWVIIGGESGGKARPMPSSRSIEWLANRYASVGIPVFIKQMSQAEYPGKAYKDINQFPKGLQRRGFPQ